MFMCSPTYIPPEDRLAVKNKNLSCAKRLK